MLLNRMLSQESGGRQLSAFWMQTMTVDEDQVGLAKLGQKTVLSLYQWYHQGQMKVMSENNLVFIDT